MKTESTFKIKLVVLAFFAAVFIACFIPDRYLGNCIIPLRNTYFVLTVALFGFLIFLISLLKGVRLPIYCHTQDVMVIILFGYIFLNYTYHNGLVNDLFVSFLCLVIFYFAVKLTFQFGGDRLISASVIIFLLTGIVQGIYGFLQITGWAPSRNENFFVTGSFFNSAPYGTHLMAFLPFSLAILTFLKGETLLHKTTRLAAIAAGILAIIILPVTQSRTAWVAGIAGILVVLFVRYNVRHAVGIWFKPIRNKFIAFFLLLCVLFAGVLLYKFKENSVHGRLFIWKFASGMVYEKPILGMGFNGVREKYNTIQAEYFEAHPHNYDEMKTVNQVNYVFNDYLQILIEEGIAGLLIFLGLIVSTIYTASKTIRNLDDHAAGKIYCVGALSSLIALLITFFTTYTLESLPAALNFFFFMAVISASANAQQPLPVRSQATNYPGRIMPAVPAIIFLVLFIMEFKSFRSYLQVTARYSAIDRLTLFRNNYDQLKNDPAYTLRYGKVLAELGKHQESIAVLNLAARHICDTSLYRSQGDSYKLLGNRVAAETSYLKAIAIAPQRFTPRLNMVAFYLEQRDTTKALSMAHDIVAMPVRSPSEKVIKIRKDMENMINEFK